MKYSVLLFDMDDTILDYGMAEKTAFNNAYTGSTGAPPDAALLSRYREINSSVWRDYEKGLISQEVLRIKRFEILFSVLGINLDSAEFSRKYLEELGKGGFLIEGAKDVLDFCRKHYRIAAVTNGIANVQKSRVENAGLSGYFETVVISSETGVAKPDPGIFNIVFERMSISDRRSVLMIGDSLSSDIQGGINAGIDTCWLNHNGVKTDTAVPVYTISKISELPEILN